MKSLFDSAWRAAAYCLHPKVIALSLLPLVLIVGLAVGLSYFFWVPAMDAVHAALESSELLGVLFGWLEGIGAGRLKSFLPPLIVVLLATPVLVLLSLLAVATMMSPTMLKLVAQRRFPKLERLHGGSFTGSVFIGLGSTLVALLALLFSIPLWFVPPLVLIVPPLIWGWLTYRVMSYDALSEHASKEERLELVKRHRASLLAIGVLTGYLGAAPSLVWVTGAMFIPLAPILVPIAIWIYTLVFAYSALWFSHYALAALAELRAERNAAAPVAVPMEPALPEPLLPLPPM